MFGDMDSNIWIGISPDLLLGGFDTRALLQCDHYLEFKLESRIFGSKKALNQEINEVGTSNNSLDIEIINFPLIIPKDEEDLKPKVRQKRMKDQSKMDGLTKCERCKKLFLLQKSLVRHIKFNQCKEKGEDYVRPSLIPRMCPECGKRLKSARNLKEHVNRLHLNIKVLKHQCSQCGRTYGDSRNLNRHIETVHLQETFYCEYCPESYTASVYLREHTRRQHNETAVECYNCKKKFIQRRNLDSHIQNGICGEEHKEFNKQKKAKKTVNCPHCPGTFPNNSSLRKHVNNVHINGSKYSQSVPQKVCGYCDFQTPFNKKLNTHIKIIHPTVLL